MVDYSLRECPFCGNPAEIIDAEPYEWCKKSPVKQIVCSNEWCFMHIQGPTFMADVSSSEAGARAEWNQRKRKNKITWEGRSE